MEERRLRTIAVVGGGVAGSMAAAALSRLLKRSYCEVVLVARPEASALAAEASIPALQRFHNLLGIDEDDFIRKTEATFSLGVEFRDWSRIGDRYFHTFCEFGGVIASVPFQHYWRKLRGLGDMRDIGDYSIATAAAKRGRFARPVQDNRSVLSLYSHAFHFDSCALRALPAGLCDGAWRECGGWRSRGRGAACRRTGSSNGSSWQMGGASRPISSSIAPMAFSSRPFLRPATRTGAAGFPATAPFP